MGILMKNSVNYSNSIIEIKPEIYSLDEREIGVWTDGKPLYQKTYIENISGSGDCQEQHIDITALNVDSAVNIEGIFNRINDGTSFYSWYPFNVYENPNIFGWARFTTSDNNIAYRIHLDNNNERTDTQIITLQYTKTTDTPGSGIWATNGAPAKHYSTTEQVIGTWIDGSTVYEKTFDLGTDLIISQSSWTSTGILVSDIGKVLSIWAMTSAGTCWGDLSVALNINSYINLLCARNGDTEAIRYFTIQYIKSS